MSGRHPCPGCGKSTPYQHLACGPCWRALPDDLRRRVNVAWKRKQLDPREHREAMAAAVAWYRNRNAEGPCEYAQV